MIDLRIVNVFTRELALLRGVTSQYGWCEDDPKCKIIDTDRYVHALTVAIILAKCNPRLDLPVPGADPEGFLWLTYTDGPDRGLALELCPGKYRWTQSNMGDKRTFESTSLNDVAEAMRTVFPQAPCLS